MKRYYLLIFLMLILVGCTSTQASTQGNEEFSLEKVNLITEGSERVQEDGNKMVFLEYQLTVKSPVSLKDSEFNISYEYTGHSAELVSIETEESLEDICKRFSAGNCVEDEVGLTLIRFPITLSPNSPFHSDDLKYLEENLDEIEFTLISSDDTKVKLINKK